MPQTIESLRRVVRFGKGRGKKTLIVELDVLEELLSAEVAYEGVSLTIGELKEEHKLAVAELKETIRWMAQTVHQAFHEGPLEECRKNICDAALQARGER